MRWNSRCATRRFAQRRAPARRTRARARSSGRRAGAARSGAARLRPAARARRRPRHPRLRTKPWPCHHPGTTDAGHRRASTDQRRGQLDRRRQGHARRATSRPFLHAAHHAAEEPEPARPARHQPVHPAARAVRAGRAAAQVERSARHAGLAAEDRAVDRGAGLRRPDRRRSTARPRSSTNGAAIWSFNVAEARDRDDQHQERDRARPSTPATITMQCRHAELRLGRQGHQRHAMAGRQLHDLGHRARTRAARRSRSRPRSRASSIPSTSRRTRRCFRSPARTTRSTRSSAWSGRLELNAVTLRSFLAAGDCAGGFSSQICWQFAAAARLRHAGSSSKLAAIFTQLSDALSQILSRGR